MKFRLDQITPLWTGVDDTTPAGHCLVHGTDPLGRQNLFLYFGDTPSDDGYRGRVQMPFPGQPMATAYDGRGTFCGSGADMSTLLARLTVRPTA